MERLQKVLAQANISSRRKSEEYILAGRVKVNGVVVTTLGTQVSKQDVILVDDKPLVKAQKVYYLVNKPAGCASTVSDEQSRKTILDLLDHEDKNVRLYPIGKLDFDTAGLLLITNDGDLTYQLTHPENEVEKEYLVRVEGIVIRKKVQSLRNDGVLIDKDYLSKPKAVSILELDKTLKTTLLSIVLVEGRTKEVRKIFEAIGHKVKKLTRVRYDFLTLDVDRGTYRPLKPHEIKKLYQS